MKITLAVLVALGLVDYDRAATAYNRLRGKILPDDFWDLNNEIKEALEQ